MTASRDEAEKRGEIFISIHGQIGFPPLTIELPEKFLISTPTPLFNSADRIRRPGATYQKRIAAFSVVVVGRQGE